MSAELNHYRSLELLILLYFKELFVAFVLPRFRKGVQR